MTKTKVVKFPDQSELDKQFVSLEKQQQKIKEQQKLIQERYK